MLQVSQLTRCYGSFVAVDNVGFTIGKGEIVGLLGHNGAGKTTIMKMLSGYLEPNQGRVSIDGINLATEPNIAQRQLGYLPESLPLYPELSVADYLDYAAELKGLAGDNRRAEIRRAVRATDIGAVLLAQIATLSRGYRQRVGVAQAILGKPRLLIMDEPTNGLDPTQTEHMRQLIRDIARDATVILSTHIMQEVDALCDRALILRDGRLVVDARLEDLRRSDHLLLDTSMPPDAARRQLPGVAGVDQLEVLDKPQGRSTQHAGNRYRIKLAAETAEGEAANAVCAALARSVVDAGAELYRLQPEYRDLETLFREVSSAGSSSFSSEAGTGEVISNAA